MLPVPIDAASAVMNAWNGLRAPVDPDCCAGTRVLSASPKWTTWTRRYRIVRKMPLPSSSAIVQGPKIASAHQKIARASRSLTSTPGRPWARMLPSPSAMKAVITGEDVLAVPEGGELQASPGTVITPWARELAEQRRVRLLTTPAAQAKRLVAIGADHGGFPLKEQLKKDLTRLGHAFRDVGTFSTDAVDYPDIALAVAQAVRGGEARF